MRTWAIAVLMFVAGLVYAESYNVTTTDTNLQNAALYGRKAASQTWGPATTNTFDYLVATNLVVDGSAVIPATFCCGYIHESARDFTAAAGWEVLTGFVGTVSARMGTPTDSNQTVITDGWYEFTGTYSFDCSAVGTEVVLHGYTNGILATNISCHQTFLTAATYGNMTMFGMLYLYSNSYVDIRIDVDKNCTLTFDQASMLLKKVGN